MVWRERRNHQRRLRGRVGADGGIVVAGDGDGDIGCPHHLPRENDGVALGFDYAHVEGGAGVEAQVVDKECGLERGRGGIGMSQGNEVCVAGCRTERDNAVFPHAGLAGYDGEHPREAGGVGGIGHGAHQESVGGMFGIDPQPQRYLLERVDVDGRGDDAIGYAQGIGTGVGRAVADGGGGALRCPVFRYAVDREVVEVEADGRNDGRGERVYTLCIVAAHGVAVAAEVEVVIVVGCKGQQGRIGGDADQGAAALRESSRTVLDQVGRFKAVARGAELDGIVAVEGGGGDGCGTGGDFHVVQLQESLVVACGVAAVAVVESNPASVAAVGLERSPEGMPLALVVVIDDSVDGNECAGIVGVGHDAYLQRVGVIGRAQAEINAGVADGVDVEVGQEQVFVCGVHLVCVEANDVVTMRYSN